MGLRDPRLAEFVGDASRKVFIRIVDLCVDESVDALLLAGDLYDGERTSMKTARFLAEQLSRPSSAVIILASPNTPSRSPKARWVVIITEACS